MHCIFVGSFGFPKDMNLQVSQNLNFPLFFSRLDLPMYSSKWVPSYQTKGSIAVTNKTEHALTGIFFQDGRLEVTILGDQPPDKRYNGAWSKLIKVI